ncbi:MAG TPA: TonB-dependent receptor, partial [Vicinamibacterales bacterium]|nr:TonB-dependent receptor [Vicinamibacterales bacterium]
MRRRVAASGLVLLALMAIAVPARAQRTTGEIVGTVTDESGAVLPGVTVTIRGAGVPGAPTVVTSETGAYRFPALPPGEYSLEFALQGFAGLRREAIPVGVGAVIDLKIQLKVSTLSETVTVTGESPVVNLSSTTVSTNYNREWVLEAPIRRFSFFDLVNSAPGVSATSTLGSSTSATSLGSSINDNVYAIDGTDLSSPISGTAWPWPNADAIQEIEVMQLGASAEYGNAVGAVFNVVTRQGSNEFHGDGSYYFMNDGMTGRNTTVAQECQGVPNCPATGLPYHRAEWKDTTWQLSGPFVRDKFWFFGSFQYQNDFDSQPGTDPAFPAKSTSRRVFYKFNYNITPNHRLMHGYHDDYWSFPGVPSALTAPSTVSIGHGDNPTPNLVYTGVLSSKTLVEARLAGYYGKDSTDPQQAGQPRVQTRYNNLDTGAITGGIYSWNDEKVWRTGVSGKISHFADSFMGGSHDVKLGVQYSGGGQDTVTGPNDYLYITGGRAQYGFTRQPWHSGGLTRLAGIYADDTYRLGNVTLNLGVRYDHSRAIYPGFPQLDSAGNPTGQVSPGNDNVYTWNVVSPRIGANWNVAGAGHTIVKAYFGRLYRGMYLSDFTAAVPSITPRYSVDVLPNGSYANPSVVSSNTNLKIDPNYKDPYTNEFILQLEQQLFADLGLQVNYIHKYGTEYPGWVDTTGQYGLTPYVDNRGTDASGATVNVYKLLTPSARSVFMMTNAVGPAGELLYNRYNGVTVTATKRMSHKWQGTFSLVLSKSEGREPSSILGPRSSQSTTPASFGRFPNGPNDFVNSDGLLIADRPVIAKAQIVYGLPWNVTVSGNLQHQTGRPWARQIRVNGLGYPTAPTIYMESLDGNLRVPDLNLLDMRVQKSFQFQGSFKADAYVDF